MIGFGTGKGFLVYQLHWIVGFVQEKAFWCTNCIESWIWYRKRLSGVPTHWIVDLVQEKAFWCTNCIESWIWYRKRLSGVPTALSRGVCTGKGFLVYQLHWIVGLVQGKAIRCTNALNRGFWAVETFLEYKTLWLENLVYDWVCGHWDCWSDWWKCKVSGSSAI